MQTTLNIKSSTAYIFALALTVNLHLLRNLSPLYLIVLAVLFGIGIFQFPFKLYLNRNNFVSYIVIAFFLCLIYTFSISFKYISLSELASGTPRLFITPLMCLIISMFVKNDDEFKVLINLFIVITLISCLTVFYQVAYGKISWFTGRGFRGGLERYSSLQGSLTILGITSVQALNILVLSNFSQIKKIIFSIICLLGAIFSLQKAAAASVVFVLFFIFYRSKNKFRYVLSFLFLLYSILTLFAFLPDDNVISLYSNAILLNSFGFEINPSDSIISDSPPISYQILMDRVLEYLYPYFNNYGFYNILIFGLGLKGGGSGMGVLGDQPHNSLYDLLLMGGAIFIIVGLCLVIFTINYFIKKDGYLNKIFLYNNILLLINLPFTSAGFFHPNISYIFWLSIAYIIFKAKKSIISS